MSKRKTPKPFATITIQGKITDPENIRKIAALYNKKNDIPEQEDHDIAIDSYDDLLERNLSKEIEKAAKKAKLKL